MRFRNLAVMGTMVAFWSLGCASKDDTGSEPDVEPTLELGEACTRSAECLSGLCWLDVCRNDCKDWSECVDETGSRIASCIRIEGKDPAQDFRAGFCTLADEFECASDADCPEPGRCDANGVCREACSTDEDCLLGFDPYCADGGCYDANDRGYKLLEVGDQMVASPLGTVTATVDASVLVRPYYCAIVGLDPEFFDPAVMWSWPYGQVGYMLQCNAASDDAAITQASGAGPVTFAFELDPTIPYAGGMGPQDVGLCGGAGCAEEMSYDAARGWTTATIADGFNWVEPVVVDHVEADVDGSPLVCSGLPRNDTTAGSFGFKSFEPSVGQIHLDCWPGAFEFLVETPGSTGPWDLTNPAAWDNIQVSATIDGVLYGMSQGVGTSAGASGTVTIVGGAPGTARLENVVLTSLDAPGSTVTIAEALLVN